MGMPVTAADIGVWRRSRSFSPAFLLAVVTQRYFHRPFPSPPVWHLVYSIQAFGMFTSLDVLNHQIIPSASPQSP
jgi:hypothetical protein